MGVSEEFREILEELQEGFGGFQQNFRASRLNLRFHHGFAIEGKALGIPGYISGVFQEFWDFSQDLVLTGFGRSRGSFGAGPGWILVHS